MVGRCVVCGKKRKLDGFHRCKRCSEWLSRPLPGQLTFPLEPKERLA